MAAHELPNVLLLSEDQALNALDKKIIRDAGVEKIATLFSGRDAAKYLAKNYLFAGNILVVVNKKLEDMSGEQFCRIIRLHPKLTTLPILLILPVANEGEKLLAIDSGASAALARPYSTEDMYLVLKNLAQNRSANENEENSGSIEAFEAALISTETNPTKRQHTPDDYFRAGMHCLGKKNWNSALEAFKRAQASDDLKGEAQLGLAAAWRGKGNAVEADDLLIKAAETFIAAGKWPTARTVYARIVNFNENARNPFFLQARKQINAGEYELAAKILAESVGTADVEEICEKMAQLCAQAAEPKKMFASLEEALNQRPELTAATGFLAAIKEKVGVYIKEQGLRAQEAAEKRQAALSQRFPKSQISEKDEPVLDEPSPERNESLIQAQVQVQGQAQGQNNRSAYQIPTTTADQLPKTGRKGNKNRSIALREVPKFNPLGLAALPGDSEENFTPMLEPLEPQDGGHSFFGDMLHMAKMTWKLSREKK